MHTQSLYPKGPDVLAPRYQGEKITERLAGQASAHKFTTYDAERIAHRREIISKRSNSTPYSCGSTAESSSTVWTRASQRTRPACVAAGALPAPWPSAAATAMIVASGSRSAG